MAIDEETRASITPKIIITVSVIVLLGVAIYFYTQYRTAQKRLNNPQQAVLDDVRALTKTVGKLMVLPNEDPTVATVADIDKLKNQRFFQSAINGDKVLIFNNSKKAVLYRPSINKIIEIMPINIEISPTQAPVSGTPAVKSAIVTPEPTAVVQANKYAIQNGTTVTGLAKRYETDLRTKIPTAVIVQSDNAKRRDYAKTTLIGVSESGLAQMERVAAVLGILPGSLPAGEEAPSGTDFLVIIGSDKSSVGQ